MVPAVTRASVVDMEQVVTDLVATELEDMPQVATDLVATEDWVALLVDIRTLIQVIIRVLSQRWRIRSATEEVILLTRFPC